MHVPIAFSSLEYARALSPILERKCLRDNAPLIELLTQTAVYITEYKPKPDVPCYIMMSIIYKRI